MGHPHTCPLCGADHFEVEPHHSSKPWRPDELALVLRGRTLGMTSGAIGRLFQVSEQSIRQMLQRKGL